VTGRLTGILRGPRGLRALTADARASASDLATRLGTSAPTVRRRLDLLLSAHMVRLACEVDLGLLGVSDRSAAVRRARELRLLAAGCPR